MRKNNIYIVLYEIKKNICCKSYDNEVNEGVKTPWPLIIIIIKNFGFLWCLL